MSDESLSKRARQKQRRDIKLAEERRAAASARRNRMIALAALGFVVVAAIGSLVYRQVQQRAAAEARREEVAARLEELGCTPVEAQADNGAGHIQTDQASLVAAAPDVLYPERPATSGQHHPSWVITGVYDKRIDERFLVHNLEHGYVNYYYGEAAPPDQVEQLKAWAQERIDDGRPKIIVAPSPVELTEGRNFASVAWGSRQLCEQFDTDVAQVFLDEQYENDAAPEQYIRAHIGPESGLDPNGTEGDFLLPPEGEASVGGAETMESGGEDPADAEGSSEAEGSEQPAPDEASEAGSEAAPEAGSEAAPDAGSEAASESGSEAAPEASEPTEAAS